MSVVMPTDVSLCAVTVTGSAGFKGHDLRWLHEYTLFLHIYAHIAS